MANVRVYISGS